MGMTLTTKGKYYIGKNDMSAADLRAAVFVGTAPSSGTIQDYDFLSDLTGDSTEAAASGYSRVDLASVTLTEDDSGNQATLTAAAWTMTSVASGETWTHIGYYIFNASDSAATLIAVDAPASSLTTNGDDVTGPALEIDLT